MLCYCIQHFVESRGYRGSYKRYIHWGLEQYAAAPSFHFKNIPRKNHTAHIPKSAFAPDTVVGQYTFGTEPGSISPDGYSLDLFYAQRPGYAEAQSDLIFDYQNNVKLYPAFQKYLREYRPPLLAVWGKNDPSFIPAGAEAFRRDVPDAEIHLVNSGHFALESRCGEIAEYMKRFLDAHR